MDEFSATRETDSNANHKFDINAILLSVIVSLSLSPITLSLFSYETRFIDNLEKLFIISASLIFTYVTYKLVQLNHSKTQNAQVHEISTLQGYSKRRFKRIFGSSPHQQSPPDEGLPRRASKNSWVDPRYYRPRYVAQEMRTMWNLTYTVVSWSSVMLIGGTISAGEKLFQRTLSKFPTSPPSHIQSPPKQRKANKSTGKIGSWTKRSVAYFSKRMGKSVGTNASFNPEKSSFMFDEEEADREKDLSAGHSSDHCSRISVDDDRDRKQHKHDIRPGE